MRKAKLFKTFILFQLVFLMLIAVGGCSKDPNKIIVDKWWYPDTQYMVDMYFHSDGRIDQRYIENSNQLDYYGDWYWENKSEGIIKLENISGSATPNYWLKLTEIEVSSIFIQTSSNGTVFNGGVLFESDE